MDPLIHDRDGREWLFATASNPPVEDIARSLGHTGPISDLSALRWASKSSLFEDAATQFPLPDYFGHNWDALDECVFTGSCDGRLIVIRDVFAPAEENLGRFIDLFKFVWVPEPLARDSYASLFDGRVQPGRVTVVVTGREPDPIVASWSDGKERVYQPSPLLASSQTE
jgi:RNAse (barnase) inhibitor barstar